MKEETKGVEAKIENAPIQSETVATQEATQVDYEALLADKEAKLARIEQERDNYKKGLLRAKGKLPEDYQTDSDETETQEQMFRRIAREERLSAEEAQLLADKDNAYKAVLKRNKELEVALKNRGQISSSSAQGSNQDKPEGKADNYLSNDQVAYFKAKGWNDKKIEAFKENSKKISPMPR
jgi:hypothetical protein